MSSRLKSVDSTAIIGHLGDLSTKTEEIYLKLARSLPALFREIEGGMNRANHLIKVFSDESSASERGEEDDLISSSISRAETLIDEASDIFSSLQNRDNKLFETINNSIDSLGTLENQFIDIREDSIDMEIVSLNAKIAAIRAGKNSAGFACISDELCKLSKATTNNTDILTNRGENVLQNLTSFTRKVENIQDVRQSFYKHFKEDLNDIFRNYNREVEGLVEHLTSAVCEAGSVKDPLNNIMENIQLQDIIRQSLQHVELVLRESTIEVAGESPRQILDELTFIEILYQLCMDLLLDVEEKISSSINIFRVNIAGLRVILNRVNRDSECVKNFSRGDAKVDRSRDKLTHMVNSSVEGLEVLLRDLGISTQKKSSITVDVKQIIGTLKNLESGFTASLDIVSRFYPVNINAKVEVARWESLRQIGVATDEMSDVTDKINRDMETALHLIRKITKEIEVTIMVYTGGNADEIAAINGISYRVKECYEGLARSSEMLSDTLHSFSVYSDSFFTLLDNSEIDIGGLSELIEVIHDIRASLRDAGQGVKFRKNKILTEIGMEKWILKDSKLEEVVNKFTIFTHKQTAEEIAGIELGNSREAGEAGELTLF